MRQWDRELSIIRDTREEDALKDIRFDRDNNIPPDATRARLKMNFDYDDQTIDELFAKADPEALVSQ